MRIRDMKTVTQNFIFDVKLILCLYVYVKYKFDQLSFTEVMLQWLSQLLEHLPHVEDSDESYDNVSHRIILSLLFFDQVGVCALG